MNYNKGLSLIELLVTIAIVGILTGIAYPIYANYINNSRRVQAEQTLLMMSQDMEVYHSQHGSYLDANLKTLASYITEQKHYTFTIDELTDSSYLLMAKPVGTDKKCGALTLDQLGEKGSNGSASETECWGT